MLLSDKFDFMMLISFFLCYLLEKLIKNSLLKSVFDANNRWVEVLFSYTNQLMHSCVLLNKLCCDLQTHGEALYSPQPFHTNTKYTVK